MSNRNASITSTVFSERILYYWSKLYSKSLTKGQDYESLPKVYSFNFVNFEIFPKESRFFWSFQISDKSQPEILLTDDLSIHIIEIPKFLKDVDSLQNSLEDWVYLLKEANHLKGDKMKTLTKKNPKIKKAMNELKFVSHDKKSRESYEARLKTEMDYSARFKYQLEQMKVEGKIETANELLAWGMKREQICKITGLKDSDF
ncbi:MAG: Rpn family recombination-promoting nuclease/putative transposase [Leptospiraceae bacterium]|nr:Rpn family recombination-promoting nuclease/putative transposase [Leptospiraceae bacterium]